MPVLQLDEPAIPLHEFALLWPAYSAEEQQALDDDIAARGMLNPITLYVDAGVRHVLDGVHRYASGRRLGIPIPYTLFEGDRVSALAVSSSQNARRRHLDVKERVEVAAREMVAAQSAPESAVAETPTPNVQEVADSIGLSKRHFQRALASERAKRGVASPPGPTVTRTPRTPLPAFMRDPVERGALADVARLVRRLKDIPPPNRQEADPDSHAAALTLFLMARLERSLYGRNLNELDVLPIDRPAVERARDAAVSIAIALPIDARQPWISDRCASGPACRGDGHLPSEWAATFRRFCDRCVY